MQTATHRLPAPPRHLTSAQMGRLTPNAPSDGRRVVVALDAFADIPVDLVPRRDLSNADYWAGKAREHIAVLLTALVLHKQLTSGHTVPKTLSFALTAMQIEIASRIKIAVRRHVSNGGKLEAVLRQAWSNAA